MNPQSRTKHIVCPVSEIPPGHRKIVTINGRSIGIFNIDGQYHAIRNACPHQRAPLCMGKVTGTSTSTKPGKYQWGKDGQIIRCPWHNWEFDLTTGKSVFNPNQVRIKHYDVTTEATSNQTKSSCHVETNYSEPELEKYDVGIEQMMVVIQI